MHGGHGSKGRSGPGGPNGDGLTAAAVWDTMSEVRHGWPRMVPSMNEYTVELDNYHGPLDLLLYLIKRDEIDIHDIPIAHITEQYLGYLQKLKRLDINLAGEFLVMAAMLMEIKSAMLTPGEAAVESESAAGEDPTDPRYELVQQLLAYKAFKDAANRLDERLDTFSARFARKPAELRNTETEEREFDLEDVQLYDLVEAFGRMMDQVGLTAAHEVVADDTPIELHMADLADRLERDGAMTLAAVFEGRTHGEMIGLFLALLELVRQRRLVCGQDEAGQIHLSIRPAAEAEAELAAEAEAPARVPADPRNADDFEWVDQAQKKRYIRRLERRAKGEFVEEDEELEADIQELEAEDVTEEDGPDRGGETSTGASPST